MKTLILLFVTMTSGAVSATECEFYLSLTNEVTVDPRVSQNLRAVGLDDATLLDVLRGPHVLIEDAHHSSGVLHTLYARSPRDRAVYATNVIAEADSESVRVYGLVGFRRVFEPYQSRLEEMVADQARERAEMKADLRRLQNLSSEDLDAELRALGITPAALSASAQKIATLFSSDESPEGYTPANDDDDDLKFLLGPALGPFAGIHVYTTSLARIRTATLGMETKDLGALLESASDAGGAFTRNAAYRTGLAWRTGGDLRYVIARVAHHAYAVLIAEPSEAVRTVVDVIPVDL